MSRLNTIEKPEAHVMWNDNFFSVLCACMLQ